jgi:UDP-N-acetylmuramoylalanine--D-glutamate ligase
MSESDIVVYNADDPETGRITVETRAHLLPFGIGANRGAGAWLIDDRLVLVDGDRRLEFARPPILALEGEHGARNALAAIAAAHAYGVPESAIRAGLASFQGVENRLEIVARRNGVTFVNDTSATAPAAAIAGVRVLAPQAATLHLIAGGADKRTDLQPFADELRGRNVQVYLLDGTASPGLAALLAERDVAVSGTFDSMATVVAAAATTAGEGDIVALCPACASFGMFRNEFDRGRQFRDAVRALPDT